MPQKHREQRIAFEELLGGYARKRGRVGRLDKTVREAVPASSLAEAVVATGDAGIDLIAAMLADHCALFGGGAG